MVERAGATYTPTNHLAFIDDEITGRTLLHQLYVDEIGLTEWRVVPKYSSIAEARASARPAAQVGVIEWEEPGAA